VAGAAQAQAPAGVTAAVNPEASGTPPAELPQLLEVGSNVVQNEHLSTGPQGQLQLLFRDGTTLTLGPGSDLTIDNFVYDPEAETAKLAMTAASGVFRFVGGAASKGEPVVFNTPTATIGIRGGINYTTIAADSGDTETSQAYGKDTTATSKSTGESHVLTKNGFTMQIKPNQSITTAKIDLAKLNAMLASFQGHSGATGGATSAPNQNSQQAQNVTSRNSSQSAGGFAPTGAAPLLNTLIAANASQLAGQSLQVTQSTSVALANQMTTTPVPSTVQPLSGALSVLAVDATYAYNAAAFPNVIANTAPDDASAVVFDSAGRLQSFSTVDGSYYSPFTRITAQALDVTGDASAQIGRWANGTFSYSNGTQTFSLTANQGIPYIIGVQPSSLPTAGTFLFNLQGFTKPVSFDGLATPGTFSGTLGVTFNSGNTYYVGLSTLVTMPGDTVYPLATTGGSANPSAGGLNGIGPPGYGSDYRQGFYGNVTVIATGRACSGSCSATIGGFIAGVNADHVALIYVINPNSVTGLTGAALFKK
jgi:hypothetical protein